MTPDTVDAEKVLERRQDDFTFLDPFVDDAPLACGVENPDECEACT